MSGGAYKIINTENKKEYIGSAIDFKRRFRAHKWHLRNGKHYNRYLQRAWDRYGEQSFQFQIILICEKKDVLMYEQAALDLYKTYERPRGYNLVRRADSCVGYRMTPQQIENMKRANQKKRNNYGLTGTPEYQAWHTLKNKHKKSDAPVMSQEWFSSYKSFLRDVGPRPDGMSIGKKDKCGIFDKDNFKWVDKKTVRQDNGNYKFVSIHGVMMNLSDASKALGCHHSLFVSRSKRKGETYQEVADHIMKKRGKNGA